MAFGNRDLHSSRGPSDYHVSLTVVFRDSCTGACCIGFIIWCHLGGWYAHELSLRDRLKRCKSLREGRWGLNLGITGSATSSSSCNPSYLFHARTIMRGSPGGAEAKLWTMVGLSGRYSAAIGTEPCIHPSWLGLEFDSLAGSRADSQVVLNPTTSIEIWDASKPQPDLVMRLKKGPIPREAV